jgi:hypothetical protein
MEEPIAERLFTIVERRTDDDSYFYSNTRYSWYVVSKETGDEIMAFYGDDDADASGRTVSGVSSVLFHETKNALVVVDEGTTKEIVLPKKLWLSDDGKVFHLEYESGQIHHRNRRQAIHTSKYGEPFPIVPLKNPPRDNA